MGICHSKVVIARNYIKDVSEFLCVLLTEGQIRKFIEDKTLGIDVMQFKGNKITIYIYDNNKHLCFREYKNLNENLLQAYWEVACKIAKESTIKN